MRSYSTSDFHLWDDRGSNPDALAGSKFSHRFGFRRRASPFEKLGVTIARSWSGLCLDRAARECRIRQFRNPFRPRPSSLYTFGFHASRSTSPYTAWLGVVVRRTATSSPNLSASRPVFPSGRLIVHKSAVSTDSTIIPRRDSPSDSALPLRAVRRRRATRAAETGPRERLGTSGSPGAGPLRSR